MLPLDQQVTNFPISKRLRELGVPQEINHGDFAYCSCCSDLHAIRNDNDEHCLCGDDYSHHVGKSLFCDDNIDWLRAYTVAELGMLLPKNENIVSQNSLGEFL